MELAALEMRSQLSVGADGSRFDAREKEAGRCVEVRFLSGSQGDSSRWKACVRRLRRVALLDHPGSVAVLRFQPENDPPFVITDPLPPPLIRTSAARVPWKEDQVRLTLLRLAEILREAHRLGLVHGGISPRTVHGDRAEALCLDFTGLQLDSTSPDPSELRLETACRPPESREGQWAQAAGDLFALGVLAGWLLLGKPLPAGWTPSNEPGASAALSPLIESLLAIEPSERPTAEALIVELTKKDAGGEAVRETSQDMQLTRMMPAPPGPKAPSASSFSRRRLGRFCLEELLGEGGLGQVFRAVDSADGSLAAIKVLHEHLAARPIVVKRFHKEARLLGEINNPFIVNLLEHNQDGGVHFLALEFIHGISLNHLLADARLCPGGKMPEPVALAIVMDVARALVDAHRRGIIHRDIKPQNIMVLRDSELFARLDSSRSEAGTLPAPGGAKLCDFGLARHVVESESLHMTREGAAVGTPLYMSPEQAAGKREVGAGTDVYALGATLYHLLAGRPPFLSDTALSLSLMHANDAPPPLKQFRAEVSEGVCRIVERCLAKKPENRFADGAEFLEELELLLRGEPASIALHPQLPTSERPVHEYTWTWELRSSPEELWPYVSNTERLNRAAGISAVQFTSQPDAASAGDDLLPALVRLGTFRKAGVTSTWREHPFEWIEGRRLGVLREYTEGVFKWLASTTTLEPLPQGGTRLTHHVRIETRNFLGKIVCTIEVGVRARRALEKVYQRIDAYLTGAGGPAAAASGDGSSASGSHSARASAEIVDPFEPSPALARGQKRRLSQLLDKLIENQTPPDIVHALEEFLLNASDQDVARIRPIALAHQLGFEPDLLIHACLVGAREGLFTLLWDIVCPLCRIPAGIVETLKALKEHGHCEACQADFPVDFTSSVELIFRVHPSVRQAETRTFCIGGPAHSPHVVAQIRLSPGETFQLDLNLGEGGYRVRGPQLPRALDLIVDSRAILTRLPIQAPEDFKKADPRDPFRLHPGRQRLTLTNTHHAELLLRVERTAQRPDALTAARASTLATFRQLFPGEVLESGKLVSVASVTFLAVDLGLATQVDRDDHLYKRLGETRAFALLHDLFERGDATAQRHGGSLIKTLGDGMLLAFDDKQSAVRAGLDLLLLALPELRRRWNDAADLLGHLRIALHHGPALATTINDRLDYFGATVQQTLAILKQTPGETLALTGALASVPEIVASLRDHMAASAIRAVKVAGIGMVLMGSPSLGDGSDKSAS